MWDLIGKVTEALADIKLFQAKGLKYEDIDNPEKIKEATRRYYENGPKQ